MSTQITPMAVERRDRRVQGLWKEDSPNAENTFVVAVTIVEGASRDPLLTGASVLHRRGVRVVEAELCRPTQGRCVFSATFRATHRQAETIARTFAGQVDVLDAELFRVFEGREHPAVAHLSSTRPATARGGMA